ncbi:MAG: S41 family peptidase [Candidatus Margulisbacteria bacterium]|nr:S41 family peptidase [Candidatus Margulisiibacteriota bacterium]
MQIIMNNFKNIKKLFILCLFSLSFSHGTNWKLQTLQVYDIIQNNYVESNIQDRDLSYGAIKGMLESLNDPYSRFLEPSKYSEMKVNLQGNFYGIGVHIGMKNDKLTVITPIPGTPADRAGLKSMDVIVSINNETTNKISLEEAVSKIRGPEGSKVSITIKRDTVTDNIVYTMQREKIEIKNIDDSQIITGNIGYLRLISFESKEATREVADALKLLKKKGMKSLILDLRNNGGGLLSNAQGIASLFLDDGIVVYTLDRNGSKLGIPVLPDKKIFDGPMIVIINGASASASEILAGAIKDYKRGKIVGTHSFGKASVQNIIPLNDGSAILLTIAKYLTPNGDNIHNVGIMPNVQIEVPSEDIKAIQQGTYVYSTDKDYQLQQAIKIIKSQ